MLGLLPAGGRFAQLLPFANDVDWRLPAVIAHRGRTEDEHIAFAEMVDNQNSDVVLVSNGL